MHHFRPETRRFKTMWPRFSGNLVTRFRNCHNRGLDDWGGWGGWGGSRRWGGWEGNARVMQGLHDSIQYLVVVQNFSLLRLSRGQPPPLRPPPLPVVLGDMPKNTKTATVPGRRPDSAPTRYRCKAKVKPGRGARRCALQGLNAETPPPRI